MPRWFFLWAFVFLGFPTFLRADAPARQPKALPVADAIGPMDLYGDSLPAGAVARLGTTRFRRNAIGLSGLAFLPGGKSIITADADYAVQIWDVATGRLRREIRTEPVVIRGFALAPDGKQFAVTGFHDVQVPNGLPPGEICVFALPSGQIVRRFSREGRESYAPIAISPDGKHLLSMGSTGILRIEAIASGTQVLRTQFSEVYAPHMCLSPVGAHLAIGNDTGAAKPFLWDWRTKTKQPLPYGQRLDWMGFSADGKLLALAREQELTVLDVATRRPLYRQEPPRNHHYCGTPAFTPDGNILAIPLQHVAGEAHSKIHLLEPATGKIRGAVDFPGSMSTKSTLAVSLDSRRLAFGWGTALRMIDLVSHKEVGPDHEGHSADPTHIIVSPKGLLATTGGDKSVRIWDTATGRQRRKFLVDGWVGDAALSPEGDLTAASSLDNAVHVWNIHTGQEIHRLAGHGRLGGLRTLRFLPDGKGLLSWGDDFHLRLWDLKTGKLQRDHPIRPTGIKLPDINANKGRDWDRLRVGNAAITPDGTTLVLPIVGEFRLFDTVTGHERKGFPSEDKGWLVPVISPNNKLLLVSTNGSYEIGNHRLFLIELSSGKMLQRFVLPGWRGGPMAFSWDGRMFATATQEPHSRILVYEIATGKVRCTIRGYRGQVRSLAFLPGDRRLASGQSDSTVLIWNLRS